MKGKEDGYLSETDNILVAREGNICLNISFQTVVRVLENFRFLTYQCQTWFKSALQGLQTEKKGSILKGL